MQNNYYDKFSCERCGITSFNGAERPFCSAKCRDITRVEEAYDVCLFHGKWYYWSENKKERIGPFDSEDDAIIEAGLRESNIWDK